MSDQPTNQPTKRNTVIHTYIHGRRSRITLSFHVYPDDEVTLKNGRQIKLLDGLDHLKKVDGWDQSHIIKEAIAEYVVDHYPGNPALPMEHWTKNEPFSEAAKEKLAAPPPQPKPTPNYAEMSTENLAALYSHPWKLDTFDRQLVGHILKKRGVDLEKIKKEA